ncbi:hypothetical protein AGDE_07944 [Angomonas deanei]|uniref:PRA1 family protein n=1 Tax=Angomonas deanei TaxID=59799 RepID=A0A7G2CCX4_9TRYP|nr:hypothetical protein AGDE_07944 [Angomonas deanei]CAD2217678.1 PRA1 family protein, putative [Angomonas deanei]|eukprot:EPY34382.1 hypothetical protein AGDE_07944 [Angomonas deanei]
MEHNTTTDNLPPVLQIMGKSFTSTQCYTFLCIFAVVTFFLFSGSSVVFWLAVTSVGVSALHATFRRPVPESENVLYQYA